MYRNIFYNLFVSVARKLTLLQLNNYPNCCILGRYRFQTSARRIRTFWNATRISGTRIKSMFSLRICCTISRQIGDTREPSRRLREQDTRIKIRERLFSVTMWKIRHRMNIGKQKIRVAETEISWEQQVTIEI